MNRFSRRLEVLDRFQRRHAPLAFAMAVVRKYLDDRADALAALVTFYGFLAVFPLLLVFMTLVSLAAGPHTQTEKELVDSALAQFPIVGKQLQQNIRALNRGEPLLFMVSALGFLWGAFGITSWLQRASAAMWGVTHVRPPSLALRALRGLLLLVVLGAAIVLSSVATGASTIGAQFFGGNAVIERVGAFTVGLVVNVAAYLAAFRILDNEGVPTKRLLPGALLGGIGWTVLQALGGYLVGHRLERSSELYGFFAIVLGLVFWLNIGTQLFLFATELNVVHVRHLWPRHLTRLQVPEPPGTDAEASAEPVPVATDGLPASDGVTGDRPARSSPRPGP